MSDVDPQLHAMIHKTIAEVSGLKQEADTAIVMILMAIGQNHGYGLTQLAHFRGDQQAGCFGFFRGPDHYAGMCRIGHGPTAKSAIMVRTAGIFQGLWIFVLQEIQASQSAQNPGPHLQMLVVHALYNGRPVDSFAGVENLELITAVITSALTEEAQAPTVPTRSRWFRR